MGAPGPVKAGSLPAESPAHIAYCFVGATAQLSIVGCSFIWKEVGNHSITVLVPMGLFLLEAFHKLKRWKLALVFATIWAILLIPTALNGVPFLYFDSENYITRPMSAVAAVVRRFGVSGPEEGTPGQATTEAEEPPSVYDHLALQEQEVAPDQVIFRGRSIHYGFFAWVGLLIGGFWGAVVLQGFVTAVVIALTARRLQFSAATVIAISAAGAILTPAGVFVGLVMPDFMAPLVVAVLALLVLDRSGVSWRERMLIAAIAVLAMISHNSHLALGLALVMIAGVGHLLGLLQHAVTLRGLMLALGAIVAAVAINVGTDQAARSLIKAEMVNRPHFSAHLLDEGGPGIAFLAAQCEAAPDRFQLCAYRDRFPLEWRHFLFDRTPGVGVFSARDIPLADSRRISAEDKTLAIAVVRDRPLEALRYALAEFLEQMVRFTVEPVPVNENALSWMRMRLPVFLATAPAAQGGNVDYHMLHIIDRITMAFALLAVGGMIVAVSLRLMRPVGTFPTARIASDRWVFGILLLCGLILNAAICGVLASPYDRFQARVIVLLPLGVACLLAAMAGRGAYIKERVA